MSEPSAPPKAPVAEGDVVGGKYKIERVLGQGGMGIVVAAMHVHLRQRVAIKFLLPDAGAELVTRFMREARASAKLKSEHIARVIDVAELSEAQGRAPYMVMEYLDGSDLSRVLRKRGALPVEDAVDYLLQACEAIAEAHTVGIVHRDLKPANLFLTRAADGSACVKVLDFGISKDTSEPIGDEDGEQLTRTTAVLGSPYYMAPEQMRSTRTVDARADIWSIGIILYQLVTKAVPFKAPGFVELALMVVNDEPKPPTAHRPDLPPALEAAILRALRKNPADRFASVAELAAAIAPFGRAGAMTSAERIARMQGAPPPSMERPSGALSLVPPLPAAISGSGAGTAAGSASGASSDASTPGPRMASASVAPPSATQPSATPAVTQKSPREEGYPSREALPPPPAAVPAPEAVTIAVTPRSPVTMGGAAGSPQTPQVLAVVESGSPSVPPGAPSVPPPTSVTSKDAVNAATASTWAGAPAAPQRGGRSLARVAIAAGFVVGALAVAGTIVALRGRSSATPAAPVETAAVVAAPTAAPSPIITREPAGDPHPSASAAPSPASVTQTSSGPRAATRAPAAAPVVAPAAPVVAPASAPTAAPAAVPVTPPPPPTPVVVAAPPPPPPPAPPPPKKNVLDIDIK